MSKNLFFIIDKDNNVEEKKNNKGLKGNMKDLYKEMLMFSMI